MTASETTDVEPNGLPEIVIVEDDKGVAKALETLLSSAGYQPTVFHSAMGGIGYAQKVRPAAAVIDVHLPDLNGLVLSQRLRDAYGPMVPIVVLSGDTSMEVVNSLKLVGATYFFSKPVNCETLLARLRELVTPPGK